MDSKIKIYIVEDQINILKTQTKMLSKFDEIDIIGTSLSAEPVLKEVEELKPDVILMDLGLPDINGIELTKMVHQKFPKIEILIFTIFDEEEKVIHAIKAGASGYILKGASAERILYAIKSVHEGGSFIQPSLAKALLKFFTEPSKDNNNIFEEETIINLTPREIEILQMIAKGFSNSEVASMLKISRSTIRTHLEHIYQKMDVTNRVEAITEGYKRGIIEL
ncbi:response regulator transcription factor [bacterium]|nr:response regulator transcription factor [bacterium]